jgi:hypothetical protein
MSRHLEKQAQTTRRSFLKLLGAAIISPSLPIFTPTIAHQFSPVDLDGLLKKVYLKTLWEFVQHDIFLSNLLLKGHT